MSTRFPRRAVALAVVALAASGLAPAAASASSAPGCTYPPLEQPFLRWLDPLHYVLSPDGGFEQTPTRWSLAGGAKIVNVNEPYYVRSRTDTRSLVLPAGSSATSAPMCLSVLTYPTLRAFVSSGLLGALRVDVLYLDSGGVVRSALAGVVAGTALWLPSVPVPILLGTLPSLRVLPGQVTWVAFRFTPVVGVLGAVRVDDVYVDPFKGR